MCGSACLAALVALGSAPWECAYAIDAHQSLAQLHHTVWTRKDGCPGEVTTIAQTPDGYLWLGTGTGLYRFDGNRFERFVSNKGVPLTDDISRLRVLRDGSIWLGLRTGGIRLIRGKEVTSYEASAGVPRGSPLDFAEDATGTLWVAMPGSVLRFNGKVFEEVLLTKDKRRPIASKLTLDPRGTMWVSTYTGAFSLAPGAKEFTEHDTSKMSWVEVDKDGDPWLEDLNNIRTLSGTPRTVEFTSLGCGKKNAVRVRLFDREGGAWINGNDVLMRIANFSELKQGRPVTIETLRPGDRFSGAEFRDALEDQEGNIWVATSGGLDRFRTNRFSAEASNERLVRGRSILVANPQGGIWASSQANGLLWIHGDVTRMGIMDDVREATGKITTMHLALNGDLWVGGPRELWRLSSGAATKIPLPYDEPRPIRAIVIDRQGDALVAVTTKGLLRLHDGQWSEAVATLGTPKSAVITASVGTSGDLWLGYPDNVLALVRYGGHVKVFTNAEGLASGNVQTIVAENGYAWVGGSHGVFLVDGTRAAPLHLTRAEPIVGVSGIVKDLAGDMWVSAGDGVTHIAASELAAFVADKSHKVSFETFTVEDGLEGSSAQTTDLPSVARSSDGRVWVSTSEGIYWIDPAHIARRTAVPRASIESVTSEGRAFSASGVVELPVATSSLQIDYTAPSLTMVERVRFRYRLDGVDRGWQEAETRRQAFYTRLQPGSYLFHVIASNEDGVWGTQETTLAVRIPPFFYQTLWFFALCVLLALLLVWGAWKLRLRQIATQIRMRTEERVRERERIARDLHDTLLQGTQGLVLSFQVVASELPPADSLRRRMEGVLDQADRMIVDAREKVTNLRSRTEPSPDLLTRLEEIGAALPRDGEPRFSSRQTGEPRQLDGAVQEELYSIGREALANAIRHSGAKAIVVEVNYAPRGIELSVSDDGVGFDESLQSGERRVGHWGLTGMRERATHIGSRLVVSSGSNVGTRLSVTVPASRAYVGSKAVPSVLRRWRRLRARF